ncbi:MAG TPA: NAD(P)-dependent alcohol dehydrogenase [Pyrinomonadaceae bacterium]
MKAVVYHEFGPADVLKCEDVPKPAPKENEVLIKVRAASINPLDWRMMKGEPRFVRLIARLWRMTGRMGVDVAGEVEAIGPNVKAFKPGDKVFGTCRGAFADYACTPESKVAPIPDKVTFEQAASVNVAGLSALQGLRDRARIQRGEKVLINGAAGGVGTFAVQIAKTLGAEVTGVCSTRNVEMVKSIGANAVIDYTKEDFSKLGKCYDVIFDCIGNKSHSECRRVLNPKGRLILVGAPHDPKLIDIVAPLIKAVLSSPFMSRKVLPFIGKANKEDLSFIAELIATGKITPVIDRCYSFNEAADAVRYVEKGHARGKVLLVPA